MKPYKTQLIEEDHKTMRVRIWFDCFAWKWRFVDLAIPKSSIFKVRALHEKKQGQRAHPHR